MTAITERLRRLARQFQRPVRCTACGFPRAAGRRLISGPWGVCISFCGHRGEPLAGTWPRLAICTSCTEMSRRIFSDDNHARER